MNLKKHLLKFCFIGLISIGNVSLVKNAASTESGVIKQSYITINMHSKILDEDRVLRVHLPDNYEASEKQYPVIYLLDGDRHFSHAITAANILQGQSLIPQSIIVAILNNNGTRRRDLSSEKDNFLKFIDNEIFSIISKSYRTSAHKTLFGHSMAGAFTMGVLATKPEMFNNYIAASPVIQMNDSALIEKYKNLELSNKNNKKSLYLTFGNDSAEGKNATKAFNQFINLMTQQPNKYLLLDFQRLPNQVHMTTPYITFYAGITFSFHDFQAPSYLGYQKFEYNGKMKGLESYYTKRASKYYVSKAIPENVVRRLGFAIFDDGHQLEGIEILSNNAYEHPNSLRALNALAQANEEANNLDKALAVYEKAIILAKNESSGNLVHFERQVTQLKKKIRGKNK